MDFLLVFKVPWVVVEITEEESDTTHTLLTGAAFYVGAAIWVLCSWSSVCVESTDALVSLTELASEAIHAMRASMLVRGGHYALHRWMY